MKLFISWSGDVSCQIAQEIRDWIPLILNVKPFMTASDIEKGAQWPGVISRELEQSNYGIVCLTRDNLQSQWLAFEAGALAKHMAEGRVMTVLFGGLRNHELRYPLSLFQSTLFNEADFRKLLGSIDTAVPPEHRRENQQLDRLFSKWWPDLEK